MRLLFLVVACAVAGDLGFPTSALAQRAADGKKLIEFGWDEPDTAFLRRHIAEMEKAPFDGTVFHLMFKADDGSMQNYVWHTWGTRAFEESDFQHAIEDLKNTPLKRFTHNFLRFNTSPANIDWFDDFSAVLGNARLAARIARDGKAAGILFDIEQYNEPLFNYSKQRHAKAKPFDEYAKQARRRGGEVMDAFQEGYPDLTILMTWAYSLPHIQSQGDSSRLPQAEYGLLKPFLDGMFEAARGKAKIVDGYESSYSYREPRQFDEARTLMTEGVLRIIDDSLPDNYRRHGSAGFGLWMDYDWRNKGWDASDFSKNHFTPAQFESSVRKALETADEYVWIYTETPKWWTPPDGRPEKLPAAYDAAVRRAGGK